MKKILAMLLALVMVFALVACGNPGSEQPSGDPNPGTNTPADPGTPSEPSAPVYEDMGTIMWLSNLSSGAQYDAAVSYLTAICDALGYEFTIVYGDPFNDAAGNLLAVQNAMTDDVVGLIASQDGGIGAIMEEYPNLYVAGYNTDMRSIYTEGGENSACLNNDHFLGSIADGYAHGHQMGLDYANGVISMGYRKVAIVDFPAFAYPSQAEAAASFMAAIEEYNTANPDKAIEVIGEKTTLMFEPLPDSWFLEEGHGDLDAIVAMCAGQLFVYPTLITAKSNGICSAETKMITGGFEADPALTADVGEGRTITRLQISPMEACAYALVLIDNAVTGHQYADHSNACVDSGAYVIDSIADIDNVMSKSLLGTAKVELAQISVADIVALCGRSNPNYTQAELVALIQSLTPDTLK